MVETPTVRIRPRGGLVLVRLLDRAEQKIGKIVVPSPTTGSIYAVAVVLEVGPGTWDGGRQVATEDLKPGQRIIFQAGARDGMQSAMAGVPLEGYGGQNVRLINQSSIAAILEGEAETAPATPKLEIAQ